MIEIAYPNKALWPNGRAHWRRKAGAAKALRREAYFATKAANITVGDGPYSLHITVYRKAAGPFPDRDNAVAAAKSAIDGIADALGLNDRHFSAPTVSFAPEIKGKFVITIGSK